jgi:hypothetical protein
LASELEESGRTAGSVGLDVDRNGGERSGNVVEERERERSLPARFGRDAGGTMGLACETRVVLDPHAGMEVGAGGERAVVREDALEWRTGDGAREVLVVAQPPGREDAEKQNPCNEAASKLARILHPTASIPAKVR